MGHYASKVSQPAFLSVLSSYRTNGYLTVLAMVTLEINSWVLNTGRMKRQDYLSSSPIGMINPNFFTKEIYKILSRILWQHDRGAGNLRLWYEALGAGLVPIVKREGPEVWPPFLNSHYYAVLTSYYPDAFRHLQHFWNMSRRSAIAPLPPQHVIWLLESVLLFAFHCLNLLWIQLMAGNKRVLSVV